MSCEICGRSACMRSFHSLESQAEFDDIADVIKDRMRSVLKDRIGRIKNITYDENDIEYVNIEDVFSIIDDY